MGVLAAVSRLGFQVSSETSESETKFVAVDVSRDIAKLLLGSDAAPHDLNLTH